MVKIYDDCKDSLDVVILSLSEDRLSRFAKFLYIDINWYEASGFTGLFNTKDHGAITLVI